MPEQEQEPLPAQACPVCGAEMFPTKFVSLPNTRARGCVGSMKCPDCGMRGPDDDPDGSRLGTLCRLVELGRRAPEMIEHAYAEGWEDRPEGSGTADWEDWWRIAYAKRGLDALEGEGQA